MIETVHKKLYLLTSLLIVANFLYQVRADGEARPNIILIMTDDQGWGQTGYNNHPHLKTPNLDAMAANGLRFNRFYAGSAVCSPTRATVLTGRTAARTGVPQHGHKIRLQEKFLPEALREAGYATAHFGKWHLSGVGGPGAPVLADLKRYPSPQFLGFEHWLTNTNYFDLNPLISRNGITEELKGDSSDVIVAEAIDFIETQTQANTPFFSVIWYGSPHSPMKALSKDKEEFSHLPESLQNHLGEIVAIDRSVGTLRKKLRDLKVDDNTLIWFCSDNGGLVKVDPDAVASLRGYKNMVFEGGLRVPGIIEWPAKIKARISNYPASTLDIFPTIVDILNLPKGSMLEKVDGESILPLFSKELPKRSKPIPFKHNRYTVIIDNNYKIILNVDEKDTPYSLYDLVKDPSESNDLYSQMPELSSEYKAMIDTLNQSIQNSLAGKDYPEGKLTSPDYKRVDWPLIPEYQDFVKKYHKRPEYKNIIRKYKKKGAL